MLCAAESIGLLCSGRAVPYSGQKTENLCQLMRVVACNRLFTRLHVNRKCL